MYSFILKHKLEKMAYEHPLNFLTNRQRMLQQNLSLKKEPLNWGQVGEEAQGKHTESHRNDAALQIPHYHFGQWSFQPRRSIRITIVVLIIKKSPINKFLRSL